MTLFIIVAIFCCLGIFILVHQLGGCRQLVQLRLGRVFPLRVFLLFEACQPRILSVLPFFLSRCLMCLPESLYGDVSILTILLFPFLCVLLGQREQVLLSWLHHGMAYSKLSRLSGNECNYDRHYTVRPSRGHKFLRFFCQTTATSPQLRHNQVTVDNVLLRLHVNSLSQKDLAMAVTIEPQPSNGTTAGKRCSRL